jgi:hypothetical protein
MGRISFFGSTDDGMGGCIAGAVLSSGFPDFHIKAISRANYVFWKAGSEGGKIPQTANP